MNREELVEKVGERLDAELSDYLDECDIHDIFKAIEDAGYAIVPVTPNKAMISAYFDKMQELGFPGGMNASTAWEAMIKEAGE